MNFLRRYKIEIAIFALACIVRLLYLGVSIETYGDGDLTQAISGADGYYIVSKNLIEGHGLSSSQEPPYEPYSFRPPLYHFFIAGTYSLLGGYWGVILLQIFIASLLPLLGMRLARYLHESRWISIAVGVLLAVEPSAILYATVFYSETFFMFLFFLSLWALFEYIGKKNLSLLITSGALLGLATLARPTSQFIPFIVIGVLLWQHRGAFSRRLFLHLGAFAAAFLVVISPWVYRNYTTFGVVGLSPQTGVNLRMTLLPTVLSIENGTTFQKEFATLEEEGVLGPNNASILDGSPYARAAIPELLARPKALTLSVLNSAWSFFVLDGVFDFLRHIEIRPAQTLGKPSLAALFSDPAGFVGFFARNFWGPLAFILTGRIVWIGIAALFLYGTWRYLQTRGARPEFIIAFLIVLYMAATASITGYGQTARYHLPTNAIVLTFAVYGASVVLSKFKGRT